MRCLSKLICTCPWLFMPSSTCMEHFKRAIDRDHLLDKDLIISNDTKVAQAYVLCDNITLLFEVEK